MNKEEQMFERIGHWQQSGLSQKSWCKQNNIAYATFQYWYKRFRSAAEQEPVNDFVPLIIDRASASYWCELIGTGGKRIVFHQPVSAEFLNTLMS
jgi:hypothetical protein